MAGWAGLSVAALILWAATWIPALRALRVPIAVAFAVRGAAALVHVYVVPLPDSSGDAVGFEELAWRWSRDGFGAALGRFESGAFMYSWFGALLYSVAMRSPLLLVSANVLAGALAAGVTGALAGELAGERAARWACWATALFPASVLYSALTVREAWIVLFLTYGALCAARWHRGRGRLWLAAAMAALLVGSGLNSGLLAAAAVVALDAMRALPVRPAARAALMAGGGVCVALGAAVLAYAWGREDLTWVIRPELFGRAQQAFAVGNTAYLQGLHVDSVWDVVWQAPVRVGVFLFGFPWWRHTLPDALAGLDALFYVGLTVLIVRRARGLWDDRAARAVLGVALGVTLLVATFTGNHGTALRHRAKVAPLMIALAAAASLRPRPTTWENEAGPSCVPGSSG